MKSTINDLDTSFVFIPIIISSIKLATLPVLMRSYKILFIMV